MEPLSAGFIIMFGLLTSCLSARRSGGVRLSGVSIRLWWVLRAAWSSLMIFLILLWICVSSGSQVDVPVKGRWWESGFEWKWSRSLRRL